MVDSNPYSRLMALQRMGIVKDYERIRDKTVCGVWLPHTLYIAASRPPQGARRNLSLQAEATAHTASERMKRPEDRQMLDQNACRFRSLTLTQTLTLHALSERKPSPLK